MTPAAVVVRGVDAGYGSRRVLAGVDLDVAEGEAVAVVGPNGSGKTTLMRVLGGLLSPWRGTVTFAGRPVTDPRSAGAAGVGWVPERCRVVPELTVAENLLVGVRPGRVSWLRRERAASVDWVMDVFPGLRARAFQKARDLPVGDQQVLALARALVGRPKLLLVDEISAGLSPALTSQLFDILRGLSLRGTSLVMAESLLNPVLALADRVVVVDNGRVSIVTEPGTLSVGDVSWQSTQPGGGNGASTNRSKGAPG